jgi:hypothetical protein
LLSTLFGTGSPLLGIDGHGAHRRRRRLGPLVQESVTRGRSVTDAEGEVVAAARAVPTRVTRTELCSRTWQSTVARMRGTRWSTMVRMRGDAVEHNSDDVRGTPMPPILCGDTGCQGLPRHRRWREWRWRGEHRLLRLGGTRERAGGSGKRYEDQRRRGVACDEDVERVDNGAAVGLCSVKPLRRALRHGRWQTSEKLDVSLGVRQLYCSAWENGVCTRWCLYNAQKLFK